MAEARRLLHLDCFSGISGNMFLGALLDLGVPAKVVRAALASLELEGLRMRVTRPHRGAIHARHVSFSGAPRSPVERRFRTIRRMLERSKLSEFVRGEALRVFERLAKAEARVHGTEPDEVHFHEVGAVDAIADIVGACAALEHLDVARVSASPVALGSGSVETEHGRLPLPAPATLELLRGIPTYPAEVRWETVTPTGAALLASFVDTFGSMPPLAPLAQGFGAGEDRPGPLPNVLRGVLGRETSLLEADRVTVLETHLDDMNPEHLPYLMDALLEDGALDVSLTALAMKKGRPGQLLRVISRPGDRDRLARRILLESSTLGVRFHDVSRLKRVRESRSVRTSFGLVRVKLARSPDGGSEAAPEYEDCARAARKHGVPLQRVYREALRALERELP